MAVRGRKAPHRTRLTGQLLFSFPSLLRYRNTAFTSNFLIPKAKTS